MKKREELEKPIASQLGHMLADHFGRGPRAIHVQIVFPFVVVHLNDFLAPMEDVLLRQGDTHQVEQIREQMMAEIAPSITKLLETELNVNVSHIHYDWNFRPPDDCTGCIWAVMDMPKEQHDSLAWPTNVSTKMLHRQIQTMSVEAQRQPDDIQFFWLGKQALLVERTGIFLAIEKELMNYGHEETLKVVKRPLEKKYLIETG